MTTLDALFDGATFDAEKDFTRLSSQYHRVLSAMLDSHWRSLREISALTGDPESSVSARLRDARKSRFGKWTVERRRRSVGLHEYRVVKP